ncbi:Hypothetical predicted protein [Cloeon dipterum]|uniref:Selenoprotein P N-terminal domain-containing protein n=1 Tax=Cloeon dipterum TaxID=197152 RepID=A0A8S1DZV0_9INSE|nr:Hypothetical predicted protein [Cloeon dipterum]
MDETGRRSRVARTTFSSLTSNRLRKKSKYFHLSLARCGRVTFHLSLPWSQLHLAYVKAAILATSKDQPCGTCSQGSELGIKTAPADTVSVDDVLPILQTLTNVTETNSNEIDTDEREQKKQRQLNWMRPYLGFNL